MAKIYLKMYEKLAKTGNNSHSLSFTDFYWVYWLLSSLPTFIEFINFSWVYGFFAIFLFLCQLLSTYTEFTSVNRKFLCISFWLLSTSIKIKFLIDFYQRKYWKPPVPIFSVFLLILSFVPFHLVLFYSFSLKWQSSSCLKHTHSSFF